MIAFNTYGLLRTTPCRQPAYQSPCQAKFLHQLENQRPLIYSWNIWKPSKYWWMHCSSKAPIFTNADLAQPKTNKTNPIFVAFHCIFQFPSQVSPEKRPWADDCRIAFLWFDALEALRSAVGCELQSHWWRGFVLCWCKRPGNCQATSLQSSPGKTSRAKTTTSYLFSKGIKRWFFFASLCTWWMEAKKNEQQKYQKKTSPID